ncbi:unnamed protein product [Moneuplotes crassus]|uniref:CRAL-TRIO domain-containing protein n=2 Tax=Euplotes crassus TaxID=5936 RepID=A0AAD1XK24_EUPCR|nr:unnamed protein product [Moneuplotes crassus]
MGLFGKKKKKEDSKEEQKFTGEVGCLSESQETCLSQLKQHIVENQLTTSDRFDDYYLLRFCRARFFKIKDVIKMFKEFIKWREENEVDYAFIRFDLSNIPKVKEIHQSGYHGTDREGRPFSIDRPCTAHPIEELLKIADTAEIARSYMRDYEYLLHVRMPACSAAAGKRIDTILSVIDLKGLTMGMFKEKSREFLKTPIGITQNYYPEIMHELLIINAPVVFKAIWAILKTFLAKDTVSKIKTFGKKYQEKLFERVDPDNIPAIIGGSCTCEERGGDCFRSDFGPWEVFKGDRFGEMYKRQMEGDLMTVPIPDPTPAIPLSAPVSTDIPVSVPVTAPVPVPVSLAPESL